MEEELLEASILVKYIPAHSREQATLFQWNMDLSLAQSAQGVNIFPHILQGFCFFSAMDSLLLAGMELVGMILSQSLRRIAMAGHLCGIRPEERQDCHLFICS